jgi:glucosamine-6-phosphate deaminase
VVTFNLDEYYPMDPGNPHSYHRFMWEQLFSFVDVDPANVHIPKGNTERGQVAAECAAYEDGHRSRGRHRPPAARYRQDGTHRLQRAGVWREQPHQARPRSTQSRGGTLPPISSARRTFHVKPSRWVSRPSSRPARSSSSPPESTRPQIVRRAVEGEVDLQVAATFLQRHPATTFYIDRAAAAELTRIGTTMARR